MADKKAAAKQFEVDRALGLMQEAFDLKNQLNEKVKDEEYDPEFHIARRYSECKTELAQIQSERGVESLVGGGLKFVARLQEGRKSLDQQVLKGLLLGRGIPADEVAKMFETATKSGSPYWVKEISEDKGK